MLGLQEISDRVEIKDALLAYSTALDYPGRRWELWYKCFVEEAICEYPGLPPMSARELREVFKRNDGSFISKQHLYTNVVISVKGDTASARSEVLGITVTPVLGSTVNTVQWGGAWFDDTFKRIEQGWRVHHRVVHLRWRDDFELTTAAATNEKATTCHEGAEGAGR
jgi:hypothetical protein